MSRPLYTPIVAPRKMRTMSPWGVWAVEPQLPADEGGTIPLMRM